MIIKHLLTASGKGFEASFGFLENNDKNLDLNNCIGYRCQSQKLSLNIYSLVSVLKVSVPYAVLNMSDKVENDH